MRIARIEAVPIAVPLAETFRGSRYSMSERATIVTRIHTDDGAVGVTYNGDEIHTQVEIARIMTEELFPLIEGMDPLLIERCWEAMLAPTMDILRDRRLVVIGISAIDSALWDLAGKTTGLPISRLWGGYRSELPVIAIGGYYGKDDAELGKEVEEYLDMGIGGCKMKIGGASPAEDARRFLVMRDAGGPEFVLMADANQGYTVAEAVEFAKRVEDHGIRWLEEPVKWFNDVRFMRDVRMKTSVAITAGQSEFTRKGVTDLIASGAIDVCNFDASWSGGPTEWRRVAGVAVAYGVELGHHEEPQIAGQLLASVPNGTYVEVFHPKRDPIFWNILANRPRIENGAYSVPQGPGWGLELDEDYIQAHRV